VSSEVKSLTFADHVRARSSDDNVAILFENETLTYRQWCAGVAERAALWLSILKDRPAGSAPHIGVLLENTPEFTMWLGAAAVTGSVVARLSSPSPVKSVFLKDSTLAMQMDSSL